MKLGTEQKLHLPPGQAKHDFIQCKALAIGQRNSFLNASNPTLGKLSYAAYVGQ